MGNETSMKYLSDRLKYDVTTTVSIVRKHPPVYNVKVTRVGAVCEWMCCSCRVDYINFLADERNTGLFI